MHLKSSKEIRESWVSFFSKEHSHKHVKSSSLIPDNPTLLLTSAGMVQFVPYFLGLKEPEFKRAVTIQKCARVGGKDSDLENIGRTTRHHTFFEMLGNFSFGDYFKAHAIPWAWDYVTRVLGLPKEKLFVSVFEGDKQTPEDKEAYEIWKRLGLEEDKIRKLSRKEVFWGPPGPTGPCGPCSEIYFDRGIEFKDPDERYLEIWNLVFMEFEKDEEGKLNPLAKKNIDTGAGLERIATILQDKQNTFETDLLKPILDTVSETIKTQYGQDTKKDLSLKIITDHIRCISFLIADNVRPTNLGRGYVLRMLIRRASRYGYLLGKKEPFLYTLPKIVSNNYSTIYPELAQSLNIICDVVKQEEERFAETIERGLVYLDSVISKATKKISGEDAFDLYSTYGFPLELTIDIAHEKNKEVDLESYEKAKEKHSEVSAGEMFEVKLTEKKIYGDLLKEFGQTNFLGYEKEKCEASVLAIISLQGEKTTFLKQGEKGEIILDQTVFYAESGGQVGDTGEMNCRGVPCRSGSEQASPSAGHALVNDTQKYEGLITHYIDVKSGKVNIGDIVTCEIDSQKRARTRHHHSVTHLMHSALRKVFGEMLQQAGSEVNHERTRFDFTLDKKATKEELEKIEDIVNSWIKMRLPVKVQEMSFNEAMQSGALAFFGDKYEDKVRVIKMATGSEIASIELCGGTHVKNTSEIKYFKIIKESSIAAGTRRIEAVAGDVAKEYEEKSKKEKEGILKQLIEDDNKLEQDFLQLELKKEWEELCNTYGDVRKGSVNAEKLKEKYTKAKNVLSKKKASIFATELKEKEREIKKLPNGIQLLELELKDFPNDAIKIFIEGKVKSEKNIVFVISNVDEGKLTFFTGVTSDLIQKGINAKELVNKIAEATGGRGGGRDDFAQAGGKDISKIKDALEAGRNLIVACNISF